MGKIRYIGDYQFFEEENKLIFDNYTHFYVVIILILSMFGAVIGLFTNYLVISLSAILVIVGLIVTLFFKIRITIDSKEQVIYKELIISQISKIINSKKIVITNDSYLLFEEQEYEGAISYWIQVFDKSHDTLVNLLSFKQEESAIKARDMMIRTITIEVREIKTKHNN